MNSMKSLRTTAFLLGVGICVAVAGAASPPEAETKLLWRDPGPIAQRDLYWGRGSKERAPKPPFTFIKEDTSGNRPKLEVKDAAGVEWTAKLAGPDPLLNEVHAEIAATRILWALGYFVDENYFVPSGRIQGATNLTRSADLLGPDGSFKTARFERRDPTVEKIGDWNIEDNIFKGTKELSGFHAAVLLVNSWDVKPLNTAIRRSKGDDKTEYYLLSDLGSTFGSMKGSDKNSRWHLEEYKKSPYVTTVMKGSQVRFGYPLLGNEIVAIPIEHARWFSGLLSQLTDAQIRQAFQAAGATPDEIAGFSAALKARIVGLKVELGKASTKETP
jgi:hypothetical protein